MDEVGITDGAKAAGGYVYNTGAAGLSFMNSKIEENPTLASVKTSAAQGASSVASGASQMASSAAGYMGSIFGWGSNNAAAQSQPAAPVQRPLVEETKEVEPTVTTEAAKSPID